MAHNCQQAWRVKRWKIRVQRAANELKLMGEGGQNKPQQHILKFSFGSEAGLMADPTAAYRSKGI